MIFEQIHSVQSWLQIEEILDKGIIKLKDSSYVKILKVDPINYNLKSDLEKANILNSYKRIFQYCNFDLQVLIQGKDEDIQKYISKIQEKNLYPKISKSYIEFLKNISEQNKSSSKNFFIILKTKTSKNNNSNIQDALETNYKKLNELFIRCGNIISEITEEKEILNIINSIFQVGEKI